MYTHFLGTESLIFVFHCHMIDPSLLNCPPDSCKGVPVIAEVPGPAGDDEALLGALLS